MVHLGHKTEEQEHVLTKPSLTKNIWGAQGVKILCLSSIALVMMGTAVKAQQSPVYATPNNTAAQTEVRLQQMETQIRELTGRVESQIYETNKLKQEIKRLEAEAAMAKSSPPPSFQNNEVTNALPRVNPPSPGQVALPVRDPAPRPSAPQPAQQPKQNPLNLDFKPPAVTGMKTAIPGSSGDATAAYEGMSLVGMKKNKEACVALSQVEVKFPNGSGPVIKRARTEMEKLDCEG